MFENLIKSKLNIKKEANLLIVEYKKWSFKLPIYLIIFDLDVRFMSFLLISFSYPTVFASRCQSFRRALIAHSLQTSFTRAVISETNG